ncbi:Immediate early response protein (IER) [Popillia japonica]|uniref:Immediate early response protein (IER) n=1 Tax=Popillia japonica TaxID=7064 RepID=A0AAW1LUA4_POPJA
MASEAQRLIGISLTKIAQSRANRGGVSLHKNLLVATVLQKARYIFMEEAYNMVHYQSPTPTPAPSRSYNMVHYQSPTPTPAPSRSNSQEDLVALTAEEAYNMVHYQSPTPTPAPSRSNSQEDLVALTAEEAGIDSMPLGEDVEEASNLEFLQPSCPSCVKCAENQDKENQPPFVVSNNSSNVSNNTNNNNSNNATSEVTYLDLDKTQNSVLRERSLTSPCLKRRRAITDWETEEAVQSILPKKIKCSSGSSTEEGDDSVFLDDATILSDNVSKELEESERSNNAGQDLNQSSGSSAMEIDRITSLVSIFSFGMGDGKISRSVSTPDLCSAQAKDTGDALQQRQFIAMTV